MSRLAALAGVRTATEGGAVPRAPAGIVGRARELAERPAVVVGLIVLVSAAIGAFFSAQVVGYEPDELGYSHLAMGIAHSLLPFTTSFQGGQRLNQLYPLLIAPIWGTFGNVTAFHLTHLWNAALMASAAIPTYLLAREVVAPRWAAYLAAGLVAAAPWLTLATAQLTEVAAYPACTWALLAMQRSLAAPSARRDLIALLAISVAAYGRLQLIVLAPVLVLAMLLHELGYRVRASADVNVTWKAVVRRLLHEHAVLSVLAIVGAVVGLPLLLGGVLASAAGFYGVTLTGVTINSATFDLARSYFSFIALGLGAIPAVLAIGFFTEALVLPRSRAIHAFASLAVVAVLAVVFQVAEVSVRLNGSTMQERYVFFIVPLLVVGMCASLLNTHKPARLILIGTVAVALLVGTTHYASPTTAFWYQASPGMASFYDWIRPLFGAANGPMADPGASRQVLAGVSILLLGALIVLALARRVAAARVLATVGVIALVFCSVETVHALWRVIHGNASGTGFGGTLHDVGWVDRSVPGGASVQQLVTSVGSLDSARRLWEDDEFWNRTIKSAYTFESFGDPYLPTAKLSMDERTGVLGGGAGSLSPSYVVVATRGFPLQLVGTMVARSSDRALGLVRPAVPLRAAWTVSGVSPDGWLQLYRPLDIRVYGVNGGSASCAKVGLTLSLSPLDPVEVPVRLTTGNSVSTASLRPGGVSTVSARVCRSGTGVAKLDLAASDGPADSVLPLSPQLLAVRVTSA